MSTFLITVTEILLCVLVADFLSGLFHWAEDSYGSPKWPIIGKSIIAPNLLHHDQPRAMLVNSWYRSADVQLLIALWSSVVLLILGLLTWRVVLVLAVVVNANELHKWAHRTQAENGRFITWLQDYSIIQSRAHHGRHHGGARNSHYCTVTPWLNPVLDRGGLWRGIEAAIRLCTGQAPRSNQTGIVRSA